MAGETATGYTTYEVTLPEGVNEDSLALYGLGSALGWNIKQRVAFPSDLKRGTFPQELVVTPDQLCDISNSLYGTEVYGENAERFLAEEARWIKERYYVYSRPERNTRTINAISELGSHFHKKNEDDLYGDSVVATYSDRFRSILADHGAEAQKVEEGIAKLWPLTPFPFEAPKVVKAKVPRWKDEENILWWDLVPGPISRARLAHYSRTRGIAQQAVRGAIGKTHDVINVTAGLATIDEVAEKHDDECELEFVDYEEFRNMMKNSGLTRHAQDEIRHAIEWPAADQIRDGSERWRKEIIVEGEVGWVTRGGNRVPHFSKIAKVTLAHLLDRDPPTRHAAPREFLAQFAA